METLAYLHLALAFEEPVVNSGSLCSREDLQVLEGLNWKKLSGRASLYFLSLAVCGTVLGIANPSFAQVLQRGGNNNPAEVRSLQQRLQRLDYFTGPTNGRFGPLTEAALKRFQRDNGLTPDGVYGSRTEAALNIALSSRVDGRSQFEGRTLPSTEGFDRDITRELAPIQDVDRATGRRILQRGSSGSEVTQLQEQLRDQGYDPGSIDGIYGRLTENAVREFQRDSNLLANGIAGFETIEALGLLETEKNRYMVVVPGSNKTLREVRRCTRDRASSDNRPVLQRDKRRGSFVNAGEFPDYHRAKSQSEYLRSCRLDARVTRR